MNLQSLLIVISATSSATLIQAFRSYLPYPSCVRHRIMAETKEVATACGGKCIPCESLDKSHLLSADQIKAELTSMKLWSLKDGNKISRSFTSRNFQVSRFTRFVSLAFYLLTNYWSQPLCYLFCSVLWTVL